MVALILVTAAGLAIAGRTLYTPMFVLAVLLLVRLALRWRVRVSSPTVPPRAVRLAITIVASAAILLAPEFHALSVMAASDQLVSVPVLWRSSAPGVDALAFLIPNPNHALTPSFVRSWLAGQPGGFDENVASLSYVAIVVLAVAWRACGLQTREHVARRHLRVRLNRGGTVPEGGRRPDVLPDTVGARPLPPGHRRGANASALQRPRVSRADRALRRCARRDRPALARSTTCGAGNRGRRPGD